MKNIFKIAIVSTLILTQGCSVIAFRQAKKNLYSYQPNSEIELDCYSSEYIKNHNLYSITIS